MKPSNLRPAANVLGINVDAIDMEQAIEHILGLLQGSSKSYVCVAGVHGVMEAQRDSQLFDVYAGSEMTIPDGMPLVWVGHMQRLASMQRVTGPDLMREIFRRKEFSEVTHFLYGGREGVAEELYSKLTEQFPWTKIVGTYTPPYRELSDEEHQHVVSAVAELKPDIVWVGISCPRQEVFMARYLPQLKTKLMFGVGAAFDYHTGRIRDCSDWIKRAGLQWLHRLLQDPGRLWWRYTRNNPAFIARVAMQMLRTRSRIREADTTSVDARPSGKIVTID